MYNTFIGEGYNKGENAVFRAIKTDLIISIFILYISHIMIIMGLGEHWKNYMKKENFLDIAMKYRV